MGLHVLVDLRPTLGGYAGIPQEARLLFCALRQLPDIEVHGLLQSGHLRLPVGRDSADASEILRSLVPAASRARRVVNLATVTAETLAKVLRGSPRPLVPMVGSVDPDALWQLLYAGTLTATDRPHVLPAPLRVASWPWAAAHLTGIVTHRTLGRALYPRLDTRGYDIFIAQTPYPGQVSPGTRLIVRYHDAVPLLQPHTTRRRVFDSVAHGLALQRNVSDRAWFACVSESSRQALLALYPAIGGRAATVHNMLCAAYDEEPRGADEVLGVLQRNAGNRGHRATSGSPGPMAPYLLMVATLEPRKNHATLLDAWLHLRQTGAPTLQLVLVGSRGWRFESILQRLEVHLLSGAAHLLEGVPAEDLRLLYRHAVATVCPSLAEGFGYAGAEAMNCGGVVVASDLPVHREIYGDAAIYYAPNTASALKDTVATLLDPAAAQSRESRRGMGRAFAARYMKNGLLGVWSELLLRVCKD